MHGLKGWKSIRTKILPYDPCRHYHLFHHRSFYRINQRQTFQKHWRRLFCRHQNNRTLCAVHVIVGTHMTAFTILGASGEAYHTGIGVFALMASSSALVVPSIFFFVGPRIWSFGKRYGYLTQIQFFRDRWDQAHSV